MDFEHTHTQAHRYITDRADREDRLTLGQRHTSLTKSKSTQGIRNKAARRNFGQQSHFALTNRHEVTTVPSDAHADSRVRRLVNDLIPDASNVLLTDWLGLCSLQTRLECRVMTVVKQW